MHNNSASFMAFYTIISISVNLSQCKGNLDMCNEGPYNYEKFFGPSGQRSDFVCNSLELRHITIHQNNILWKAMIQSDPNGYVDKIKNHSSSSLFVYLFSHV